MFQYEKRSPHSLFQLLNKLRTTASKQESCPSVAVKNHDIIWFDLVNFELSCNPQVRPTKLVSDSIVDLGSADQDVGSGHLHNLYQESPDSGLLRFEQLDLSFACDVQLDREWTFVFRL